jgi:HPt (histidine-containing phosphotransfer) domain-containing protein
MDVQMPEMDGLETTRALRDRERAGGGHVPVVAMTAHAMEGDRERCLAAGMDGYVTKPVEADALVAAVESAVSGFDPVAAAVRLGGDRRLLREMLALFLAESPNMLQEVARAVTGKDAGALRRAAHALKGSVANFAAPRPVEAARVLERMGTAGDLSGAGLALRELEDALREFRRAAEQEAASA